MHAVNLQQVSKVYGRATAVDGVSLDIPQGEFLTLLGPSGCGKTTTLRLVAGLVMPDRGHVMLGGRDVTNVPAHRRNIGMAFQSHALFPHMTAGENIAFGLKMRGVSRAQRDNSVREALDLIRLSNFIDRLPSQLSGGQQQRVALARALVFRPHVLLLDEPFGALDRKLRELMQVELRELTRQIGMTSIFVTHDQEEALILSDRIAVMNNGRIEQAGTPGDIFERPATRFVADFMGFGKVLEGQIVNLTDRTATISVDGLSVEVERSADLSVGRAVSFAIRPERIQVHAAGSSDHQGHEGTVTYAAYQGAVSAYRIQLDVLAGRDLIVRETTQLGDHARLAVGARVVASWPSDCIRLLLK